MPPMPGPSSGEIAMAATMGAIGKSCLDLGGVVIEASQDRDLGALMRRDARTKDGVCKALSLVWIGKHAKEESFWDWLGTQGAIRWLNAQSIMATFISYGTHLAAYTGGDGDAWKDKWATDVLKPYAVIPYTGITGKVPPRIAGTLYPLGNICDAVVGYTDIYLQVSLGGTAGRHAVAFYTGFKDCSFYDPNYGEYWFPDKTKLKRWFSTFLRASTYDKVLGADYVIRRYKTG